MVVAQRDLDPSVLTAGGDLIDQVQELTLLAMVGIVDPPRPEARVAIAECHDAGIQVRMITGDHATTAAAIAGELGIEGRAITGTEFAAMSDEELLRDLDHIGVVARVAPEDKVRLVRLLKEKGNVVAMTGDGVNDAPALKSADIGVAMGITGTEVSKEAAVMILTDDNFATIVGAVSYGRTLYDNLLKYLRFQMSTLVAYIAIFIGAGIIGIANGAPLNPLQILWLNMVVDIPLAIALGFDQPARGLMGRPPRPVGAPVLSRNNWFRLVAQGAVMTVGSLIAYQIGDDQDGAVVAATMLLTTLSVFHVAGAILSRDQLNTIFDRDALPGVSTAAALRRVVARDRPDHLVRLPAADLRHGRAHLHAVVHLCGDRPLHRPRGGAHQARTPAPPAGPRRTHRSGRGHPRPRQLRKALSRPSHHQGGRQGHRPRPRHLPPDRRGPARRRDHRRLAVGGHHRASAAAAAGRATVRKGAAPTVPGRRPLSRKPVPGRVGPPRALCVAQVTSELRDGSSSSPVCAAASASAMMRFSSSRFLRYCDTE